MRRANALFGIASIGTGLALAAAVLHAGDLHEPASAPVERALYVRSGSVARRVMLSFKAIAADVYWIRTIQHYGGDRRSSRVTGRFELLFPLLDLTTTLDPQFNVAYRFGAIYLAQPPPSGPGRVDQAIALLQKGLRENPNRWEYALDIGFLHYWYGQQGHGAPDFVQAANWFERAAEISGSPIWLRQLAATTRVEGGDRAGAEALLQELATSEEEWVRRAAERGLDQLRALATIEQLQQQLDRYTRDHQHPPSSLNELVHGGAPGAVPVDPAGVPYEYDATTHRVTLSPGSPLYPLPSTIRR